MDPFSIPTDEHAPLQNFNRYKHVPFAISTDKHVLLQFLMTKYFIMIFQIYTYLYIFNNERIMIFEINNH